MKKYKVLGLDKNNKNNKETYKINLLNKKKLRNFLNIHKPEIVFHLAAQSYPKTSFDMPADTYETNTIGTSNLLESLRRYKKNALIHVCSSSEVFGRVSKEKGVGE